MQTNGRQPRVVILGAGFAGLAAARALHRKGLAVTVIDRQNHHLFQPLLYQVATGTLDSSEVASPIRQELERDDVSVILGQARSIDVETKTVELEHGEIAYDYLIIATGASQSYFGHDEWGQFAPGLKSLEDALEIRRRLFFAYEAAERETDPDERAAWLTFVVVGGGPTGVELSGALAEIAHRSLEHEYHRFNPADARIVLVEGGPRLVSAYPEDLSAKAKAKLERKGVDVRTSTVVSNVSEDGVQAGATFIPARTVFWGAGVTASPLARTLGAPLDHAGRVRVTPELGVPSHPEVFVVGDLAALEQDGKPIPGLAPAAMQEGRHAAKNIVLASHGQPMQPFRYFDKGSFAVIGRGFAVGMAFTRFKLSGLLGWLGWATIHLIYLVGFRARFAVLLNWAFAYVTKRRNAQLFTLPKLEELPPFNEPAQPPANTGSHAAHPPH
jgi:NADH:quinone reductase (non-electrogenic)